jgi:hypothetical protein
MSNQESSFEMPTVSSRLVRLGCLGVASCGLGFIALIVAVLFLWQTDDDLHRSAQFREQGQRVEVEIVAKDSTTSRSGSPTGTSAIVTQYTFEIRPTGDGPISHGPPRIAVSRTEYGEAAVGDRIMVWRLANDYALDRIVRAEVSNTPATVVLTIGGILLLAGLCCIFRCMSLAREAPTPTFYSSP